MKGFAIYNFPFGLLRIGYEDNTLIYLKRVETAGIFGQKTAFTDLVYSQVMEYLSGKRRTFDLPYRLDGTDFEKRVWQELLRIPYGETRTYKEIAAAIGHPKACRAVGMANNKNPITLIVPCHRVVGSNGALVGYAGGLAMKRALLEMEKANAEGPDSNCSDEPSACQDQSTG